MKLYQKLKYNLYEHVMYRCGSHIDEAMIKIGGGGVEHKVSSGVWLKSNFRINSIMYEETRKLFCDGETLGFLKK